MRRAGRVLLVVPLVVGVVSLAGFWATNGESSPQNGEGEIVGCVHYWNSDFHCPNFSSPDTSWFPVEIVDSILIVVFTTEMREPQQHTMSFLIDENNRAASVDAVFFTRSAVDKFAMTYYELREKRSQHILDEFWQKVPKRPERTEPRREE